MKPAVYSLDSYDRYLCLKPSFPIVVCMLFLLRHFFLLLLWGASAVVGKTGGLHLGAFLTPLMVLTDLPALAVLIALGYRKPEAGQAVRWIWRHGRLLLSASAALQILSISAAMLYGTRGAGITHAPTVIEALLAGGAAYYVLAAQRVRDVFAAFPEET